jgi:hypothetical protein
MEESLMILLTDAELDLVAGGFSMTQNGIGNGVQSGGVGGTSTTNAGSGLNTTSSSGVNEFASQGFNLQGKSDQNIVF